MSETASKIAASQARNRIPDAWLAEFNDWSNDALISFINDEGVTNTRIKAYATWEMDYRVEFGIDAAGQKAPALKVRGDSRALDRLAAKRLGVEYSEPSREQEER